MNAAALEGRHETALRLAEHLGLARGSVIVRDRDSI